MGGQVTVAPFLPNSLSQNFTAMSTDPNTPLFDISDVDDIVYKDNPAMTQARENLMVVEHVQQERAEQRRLEREEWKAQVEAERLKREIEEAERKGRELKKAELRRLTQEKEKLEEEKRVEQQCTAALHGLEKVVEQR